LFSMDQFNTELTEFVAKIHNSEDSLSIFLKNYLPLMPEVIIHDRRLEELERSVIYFPWANYIINELNSIIRGECIYTKERFKNIELSEETLKHISEKPQGEDLVRLNRRLIEEAFPGKIVERAYSTVQKKLYRMDSPLIFEKHTETKTDRNSERIEIIFNQETDDLRKTKYFISEIVDFSGGGQVTDTTREFRFDLLNKDGYNLKKNQSLTYTYSPFTGHPRNRETNEEVKELLGEVVSRPVQVIVAERKEPGSSDTLVIDITDPEVELLLTAALIDEETGALTPMHPVMLPDGRRSLYLALPPSRARVPD